MDAGRHFELQESGLAAELARLQGEVRAHADDAKLRTYLFQLLVVMGQWQRALGQLQVVAQLSAAALPMAQTYREAIRAEAFRAEVFAGRRRPSVLGEPPEWIGLLLESLGEFARGNGAAAESLRSRAFDAAPALAGSIDGKPFEWIADADPRFGPVVEAIVDGKYVWVPFERLAALRVEAPTDLRDLVWVSAELQLSTGARQVALIPTRYPGTEAAADDALRLARLTTWTAAGPETQIGLGQRMWATDDGEFALLDSREIVLGGGA